MWLLLGCNENLHSHESFLGQNTTTVLKYKIMYFGFGFSPFQKQRVCKLMHSTVPCHLKTGRTWHRRWWERIHVTSFFVLIFIPNVLQTERKILKKDCNRDLTLLWPWPRTSSSAGCSQNSINILQIFNRSFLRDKEDLIWMGGWTTGWTTCNHNSSTAWYMRATVITLLSSSFGISRLFVVRYRNKTLEGVVL